MITTAAAYISIALIAIVIGFQVALAAGAPWGKVAWGGKYPGTLPRHMRIMSLVSILVLLLLGFILSVRAGLMFPEWHRVSRSAVWVVVAYCALGVIANAATPSKWERIIWLPVVFLMLVCSTMIALS